MDSPVTTSSFDENDELSSLYESTTNERETSVDDFKQVYERQVHERQLLELKRQKRLWEVYEDKLNSELEEKEVEISKLKEEIQQLKRRLKQSLSEAELEQLYALTTEKIDRHRRELDPLKEDNKWLRQVQNCTQKENQELREKMEKHEQQMENHEMQAEKQKKQIEKLSKFKEEYECLVQENRTLKQEVEEMYQHYKSILTENKDLECQIRETTDALNEESQAKDILEIQLKEESLGPIDDGMRAHLKPFSRNKAPSLLSEMQTYFMANGDLSELEALQQRCKESEDSITALRREKVMLEKRAAEGTSRINRIKEDHTRYVITFILTSYGTLLLYLGVTVPLGFALQNINGPHCAWDGPQSCWLWYDTHLIWAFITPVFIIILANIGFFIMVINIMYQHQKRENKTKLATVKHWLMAFISLVVVMGITWIIGILVVDRDLLFVTYVYTIFIGVQGLIIFIFFVVQSKQVREAYTKWWKEVAFSDLFSRRNQMLQTMAVFCRSVGIK